MITIEDVTEYLDLHSRYATRDGASVPVAFKQMLERFGADALDTALGRFAGWFNIAGRSERLETAYNVNHWPDAASTRAVLSHLLAESPQLAGLVSLQDDGLAIRNGGSMPDFDRIREVWREFVRRRVRVTLRA